MKILIADDNINNWTLLQKLLAPYGDCDVVINGREAVEAYELAMANNQTYDLICMDIMMPEMTGHEALHEIRIIEQKLGVPRSHRVVVFMTTALDSSRDIIEAFDRGECDAYLTKPISQVALVNKMKEYRLIQDPHGQTPRSPPVSS